MIYTAWFKYTVSPLEWNPNFIDYVFFEFKKAFSVIEISFDMLYAIAMILENLESSADFLITSNNWTPFGKAHMMYLAPDNNDVWL